MLTHHTAGEVVCHKIFPRYFPILSLVESQKTNHRHSSEHHEKHPIVWVIWITNWSWSATNELNVIANLICKQWRHGKKGANALPRFWTNTKLCGKKIILSKKFLFRHAEPDTENNPFPKSLVAELKFWASTNNLLCYKFAISVRKFQFLILCCSYFFFTQRTLHS